MRILCFGDSITAKGWPTCLGRQYETLNVAEVGAKIADLESQLDPLPDADIAAGTIGTNDALELYAPFDLEQLHRALTVLRERCERVVLLDVMLFMPFHPPRYWPELSRR